MLFIFIANIGIFSEQIVPLDWSLPITLSHTDSIGTIELLLNQDYGLSSYTTLKLLIVASKDDSGFSRVPTTVGTASNAPLPHSSLSKDLSNHTINSRKIDVPIAALLVEGSERATVRIPLTDDLDLIIRAQYLSFLNDNDDHSHGSSVPTSRDTSVTRDDTVVDSNEPDSLCQDIPVDLQSAELPQQVTPTFVPVCDKLHRTAVIDVELQEAESVLSNKTYCTIEIGDFVYTSSLATRSNNPVWNQNFVFFLRNAKLMQSEVITIRLLKWNRIRKDRLIGTADLSLLQWATEMQTMQSGRAIGPRAITLPLHCEPKSLTNQNAAMHEDNARVILR